MPKSKPHPAGIDSIQEEALAVARSIQKPGQTKEQTRLIAQGIAKGIEQYKRQQAAKSRERDKLRKRQPREKLSPQAEARTEDSWMEMDSLPLPGRFSSFPEPSSWLWPCSISPDGGRVGSYWWVAGRSLPWAPSWQSRYLACWPSAPFLSLFVFTDSLEFKQ
ncbi:MAG: hypothetical protein RLZZ09_161 [Pseudomonadota bacterium]|jgi:hypothetical protein